MDRPGQSQQWLSKVGTGLFARTARRRGTASWLGRAAAGMVAAGLTLTSTPPVFATGAPARSGSTSGSRPATGRPVFLPRGQRAVLPLDCGGCSATAEYVCSDCCVDGTCCPGGNLYRQPCYDANCNLYYTYWCA